MVANSLSRVRRRLEAGRTVEPTPEQVLQSIQRFERDVESQGSSWHHEVGTFDAPVFILATGWRTGSTLLQRIIMTDPSILVFGESLGRASVIPRMTTALTAVHANYPNPRDELRDDYDIHHWPANLYPPLKQYKEALRQMLLTWFAEPARQAGYKRWGLKEVRLSAADACLLKWLFPEAKFIVLTRHPFDVYRSSRDKAFWYRWPDRPTDGGRGFIRHWNWTASSWSALPDNWGHRVLKYEEVLRGRKLDDLGDMLELKLESSSALGKRTGSTKNKRPLGLLDRISVNRLARDGMTAMGYTSDWPR